MNSFEPPMYSSYENYHNKGTALKLNSVIRTAFLFTFAYLGAKPQRQIAPPNCPIIPNLKASPNQKPLLHQIPFSPLEHAGV